MSDPQNPWDQFLQTSQQYQPQEDAAKQQLMGMYNQPAQMDPQAVLSSALAGGIPALLGGLFGGSQGLQAGAMGGLAGTKFGLDSAQDTANKKQAVGLELAKENLTNIKDLRGKAFDAAKQQTGLEASDARQQAAQTAAEERTNKMISASSANTDKLITSRMDMQDRTLDAKKTAAEEKALAQKEKMIGGGLFPDGSPSTKMQTDAISVKKGLPPLLERAQDLENTMTDLQTKTDTTGLSATKIKQDIAFIVNTSRPLLGQSSRPNETLIKLDTDLLGATHPDEIFNIVRDYATNRGGPQAIDNYIHIMANSAASAIHANQMGLDMSDPELAPFASYFPKWSVDNYQKWSSSQGSASLPPTTPQQANSGEQNGDWMNRPAIVDSKMGSKVVPSATPQYSPQQQAEARAKLKALGVPGY